MLRHWMMSAALALTFAAGAFAQGTEIEDVITRQIDAFKKDDFSTAFTFASPTIQGLFGSPQNFGRMVTNGYPMVWRPAEVEYLDLREENGGQTQRVRIVDAQGRVHLLEYFMIQTSDGWKINGVTLLQSDELSA